MPTPKCAKLGSYFRGNQASNARYYIMDLAEGRRSEQEAA
jgi:hypothetical protein